MNLQTSSLQKVITKSKVLLASFIKHMRPDEPIELDKNLTKHKLTNIKSPEPY